MLSEVYQLCIIFLFPIFVASASKWDLKMSLKDLISGHCHVVTPRVCRKYTGFGSDFTCGFILRHVCTNKYRGKQSLKVLSKTDGNVHITPLPRGISFYDVNGDGLISLNEFARTLGHRPRDLHVKVAFRAADQNGDGIVSLTEFKTTDAWVFETNNIERNQYPMGNPRARVKIGHPKFQSRVHPKPAIVGVYADSEGDDMSEEQIDSFENSQSTESFENYNNGYFEDSNEIYDKEDDSREEMNVKSQKGHIAPLSSSVDVSKEVDDSREAEEHSHEEESVSSEEYNSSEMEHTSHETFDASKQSEDHSQEADDSEGDEYEEYDDSTEDNEYYSESVEDDRSLSKEVSEIHTDSEEVEDSREISESHVL